VEVRACGTSLSERGATPRSKTKEQTGKFTSIGLLVFTREGHLSVQVMERNP
jgi:hypothetical protein